MKVLVLGSEGFIGSYLVEHYLQQNVYVAGCDVLDNPLRTGYTYIKNTGTTDFWETVLELEKFDVCINASGSGNVAYSIQQPLNDFDANCREVLRVLDAIKLKSPTTKYLHISSAAVYGNPVKLPVSEDAVLKPLSPYGWHKLMSEHICREYYELYGSKVCIIRPFSVYGNGLRKQLLWDVCEKLKLNDIISLFGTGNESRDFIHIKDLVLLMSAIVDKCNFNCDIYNAATGGEVFIKDIALLYEKYFPGDKSISFSGMVKAGDPINWKADITRLKDLGFASTVSFEEGVAAYINWYRTGNE